MARDGVTAYADLHPGDRIVAVNGKMLPEPRVVDYVLSDRVRVVPPRPSSVEWWLYADQHEVEIAAAEPPPAPEPKKPRKPPSRVVEGVTLHSSGDGTWQSEDGHYGVQREDGVTFCDGEHPVRFTPALILSIRERPHLYPPSASWSVRVGKRGYLCPGVEEHTYPVWTSWAHNWLGDIADTMGAALDILATEIRRERNKDATGG